MAFDGMQSHRCAAPPTTSRSTSVTSAPSVAATVAAVLPAGPPPMITSRRVMHPNLEARSCRRRHGATDSSGASRDGATAGHRGHPKAERRSREDVPEYRHDAILDRRVIVAADRAARPYTTAEGTDRRSGPAACPFCPGHESETPPETCRAGDGDADTPGWRIRVVPNLYP